MKTVYLYFLYPILAFLIVLTITPLFRKLASVVGLLDKPNFRKSHYSPIPVVGGVIIFLACIVTVLVQYHYAIEFKYLSVLLYGSTIILIVGVFDDRYNLPAFFKLLVQLGLAYFVYSSGIKIESLFGIFGINELPEIVKMILTILIITGTINAFNLTDGIDGLAAGLAIIGLSAFVIISILVKEVFLSLLFFTIIGSLIGFLKFNLGKKNKIFLGDAGSLFLGYILVVSGLILIKTSISTNNIAVTLSTVIGVMILPVIDSIRVYTGRISRGSSPFRADKTHLHHLLINLKLRHGKASVIIVVIALVLLMLSILSGTFFSHTVTVILLLVLFTLFSNLLALNNDINEWTYKNKALEERDYKD